MTRQVSLYQVSLIFVDPIVPCLVMLKNIQRKNKNIYQNNLVETQLSNEKYPKRYHNEFHKEVRNDFFLFILKISNFI